MSRLICLQAIGMIAACSFMPQETAAQQLTVYGKFDFGTYKVQGFTGAVATFNGNATLATAHAGGLGGSLPGFATCTLDSGIHYVVNGATTTPFPAQANAGATAIYAGKVTINASTSINKSVYVADTLMLNTGYLTIPPGDSLVITSGLPIAGGPFSNAKHIITAANVNTNSQGWMAVRTISAPYLFPVGTGAYYLPATLSPVSNSGFVAGVFEGITNNAQPGGTAFTAQQLATEVNAVWRIQRTSGNNSCQLTLGWPQDLEGSDFSQAAHIGIAAYDSLWQDAAGQGDNAANSAYKNFTQFYAFTVAQKECSQEQQQNGKMTLLPAAINKIWPNPVVDQLTITHSLTGSKVSITLYDLSGRMLHQEYAYSRQVSLKVPALRPGMYMLSISNGATTVTQPFLKQ
ncbi:T9SS type A sorting domain-containing protein [Pseudoflavitalea sp. X16]|uniref:T9SS type A sorting domain-containing protein n=1 Tax=Paraflavitalea devenefica TaxID=2716334 RepID=UPI00141ECB51|nr:T9SS type A sorting domain-containing protein [Paraflavitalea devenefica]NII29295.1 T9SS type A sorting domain-containing protein [Paraflavitalea devenefica]